MSNEPLLPDRCHIPTVRRENTPSRDATVVSTRDHQVIREWAERVGAEPATGEATSSGPATAMDFQEDYLKAIFGFIGITDIRFVRAENLSRGADAKQLSMQAAHAAVAEVVRHATTI